MKPDVFVRIPAKPITHSNVMPITINPIAPGYVAWLDLTPVAGGAATGYNAHPVLEPSTCALPGLGMLLLGLKLRRKRD